MKFYPFVLLLIFGLFTQLGHAANPPVEQQLSRKWDLEQIQYTKDISATLFSKESHLSFFIKNNRKRFDFSIDSNTTSGDWYISDSTLILIYDLTPFSATVDSVVYEVIENQPVIIYFSQGKQVLRQESSQLKTEKKIEQFNFEFSNDALQLSNPEIKYLFKFTPTEIYKSGFTLNGFFRGLLGLFTLLLIAFLFSSNRRGINWILVAKGLGLQILIAVCVLKIPLIQTFFEGVSTVFVEILNFTRAGSTFVFGGLVSDTSAYGFIFAFQVLPTIIFFSALTSLLFYLGIIQKIVYAFAWLMNKLMGLSGAESLAAAGNIFLGQTEAPLLIKPYIDSMTKSEILCLMSGGMATIAGGVLVAYVGFLGGDDPQQQLFFAKHLIIASLLSAPAAIVAAKILLPETEEIKRKMEVSKEKIGDNALESIANGTVQGLKLAVNVAAMIIVFIAFIAMTNYIFSDIIGDYTGLNSKIFAWSNGQYNSLTMQFMLGIVLKPLAWLMGTSWADSALVGQLLGEKTILNEFVAYVTLGELKNSGLFTDEKSIIIATYILCGFSNFSSIGIQIGGIGVLAPNKRTLLSQLGIKALIAGTLASLFTAVIIGMLI
ncbi:MAG: Na+ dependent nucleoside transporter [Bacteroidetes bacterium]|nr:Na+ dependent nucleoside transporter [Bacteroidota bacterium]HET6243503.1 nucleoside transporter C-terminal domain-containing protein [Bacteroidia bacterium]